MIKKGVTPYIDSYSAFFDNNKLQHTELEELIRGKDVTDVYVCGIAYDVCVGESRKLKNRKLGVSFCVTCLHLLIMGECKLGLWININFKLSKIMPYRFV